MFIQLVRYKIKNIDHPHDCIKKTDLQNYVINNYFDNSYYENIDIVKKTLKFILLFQQKSKNTELNISMSNIDML